MGKHSETTRQPDTERLYVRKVLQMERRIRRERRESYERGHDVPHWQNPVTLIELAWTFVALERHWQAATMRMYRAALLWHCEQIDTPEAKEAMSIITFEDEDDEARAHRLEENRARRKEARKSQPKTATKKLKTLPRDKFNLLIERLREARSQYADATADWLMSGALTGLRPSEWQRSELLEIDGTTVLRVRNAKNTNGRAHGSHRTLDLSAVDEHDLALVRRHIDRIKDYAARGEYSNLYKECRQVLLRASRHVLGHTRRSASLYLGRHLFTADAKHDHGRDELAALLGHASNETAHVHYARRRYGQRGRLKVRPSDEDVAAVRKRNRSKQVKPK